MVDSAHLYSSLGVSMENGKRPLQIARGWSHAAAAVLSTGFFIMDLLTYYTSGDEPPPPGDRLPSSCNPRIRQHQAIRPIRLLRVQTSLQSPVPRSSLTRVDQAEHIAARIRPP